MVDNLTKPQVSTRSILAQIGSVALAILLLYLALRNVDFAELWLRIRSASFGWVLPLAGFVFLSHILRAWRWKILVEALSTPRRDPPTLPGLFGALMAGYMVNYAAPRLGELVRTSIAVRLTGHRFAAVFGTVVAERALDMVCLLAALATVFVQLRGQIIILLQDTPVLPWVKARLWIIILLGTGSAICVVWAVARSSRRSRAETPNRFDKLLNSFLEGFRTLIRSGRPWSIAMSTVAMWACYLMMAYIPLRMLGMTSSFDLGVADAWSLMNIGALGVVVPAPGGTGSYHYITQLALTGIWNVPTDAAAAYAILTHAIQMLLYVLAGFASLVLLGVGIGSLLSPQKA